MKENVCPRKGEFRYNKDVVDGFVLSASVAVVNKNDIKYEENAFNVEKKTKFIRNSKQKSRTFTRT